MKRPAAEARVSVSFLTKSDAYAVTRALIPETVSPKTRRARVHVTSRGRVVTMRFLAHDLVALRALMNSFLRLAAAWRRVTEGMGSTTQDHASPRTQKAQSHR